MEAYCCPFHLQMGFSPPHSTESDSCELAATPRPHPWQARPDGARSSGGQRGGGPPASEHQGAGRGTGALRPQPLQHLARCLALPPCPTVVVVQAAVQAEPCGDGAVAATGRGGRGRGGHPALPQLPGQALTRSSKLVAQGGRRAGGDPGSPPLASRRGGSQSGQAATPLPPGKVDCCPCLPAHNWMQLPIPPLATLQTALFEHSTQP